MACFVYEGMMMFGIGLIPGAIGADELRSRIANMRACGSTQCS